MIWYVFPSAQTISTLFPFSHLKAQTWFSFCIPERGFYYPLWEKETTSISKVLGVRAPGSPGQLEAMPSFTPHTQLLGKSHIDLSYTRKKKKSIESKGSRTSPHPAILRLLYTGAGNHIQDPNTCSRANSLPNRVRKKIPCWQLSHSDALMKTK